jgi:hypothetical protein
VLADEALVVVLGLHGGRCLAPEDAAGGFAKAEEMAFELGFIASAFAITVA